MKSFGQLAYEAWCEHFDNKIPVILAQNRGIKPGPDTLPWNDLPQPLKDGWEKVGQTIAELIAGPRD